MRFSQAHISSHISWSLWIDRFLLPCRPHHTAWCHQQAAKGALYPICSMILPDTQVRTEQPLGPWVFLISLFKWVIFLISQGRNITFFISPIGNTEAWGQILSCYQRRWIQLTGSSWTLSFLEAADLAGSFAAHVFLPNCPWSSK